MIDTGDGPQALPVVEIQAGSGVYSFDARYNAGETTFFTPARITPAAAALVAEDRRGRARAPRAPPRLAHRLHPRRDGTPWFLEANVLPGLTETSLLPQAIEASGQELGAVYGALAAAARG